MDVTKTENSTLPVAYPYNYFKDFVHLTFKVPKPFSFHDLEI